MMTKKFLPRILLFTSLVIICFLGADNAIKNQIKTGHLEQGDVNAQYNQGVLTKSESQVKLPIWVVECFQPEGENYLEGVDLI